MIIGTVEAIEAAAARYRAQGFELADHTPHYVANYLVTRDAEFTGADYTRLVSLVRLWQSERKR